MKKLILVVLSIVALKTGYENTDLIVTSVENYSAYIMAAMISIAMKPVINRIF